MFCTSTVTVSAAFPDSNQSTVEDITLSYITLSCFMFYFVKAVQHLIQRSRIIPSFPLEASTYLELARCVTVERISSLSASLCNSTRLGTRHWSAPQAPSAALQICAESIFKHRRSQFTSVYVDEIKSKQEIKGTQHLVHFQKMQHNVYWSSIVNACTCTAF